MLPEGKTWKIGKTYRISMTIRQKSMDENGAYFEILDAASLSKEDKKNRYYLTEGGYQNV